MCEMTLSLPADPESEGEAAEKDNGALPKERMGASVVQPSSVDPRLSKIKDAAANHSKEMTTASDVATDNDFIKQLDKMVEDLSKARQRPLTPLQEIYRKQHKFEGLRLRRFKLDYLKELSAWNKKVRESGLSRLFRRVLRKPTPKSLEYANALRTQYDLFEDSLRAAIKRDLTPPAFPDFSYMHKGLEMWREAVTPPPLTLDALEKYVSEVREATDAFSDFERRTAELARVSRSPSPSGGIGTMMQKVKVSLAYGKAVRQLQTSTKKIEALLDEAYNSSRQPDDTPSLADTVAKLKESLHGSRITPAKPNKSDDKETPPLPPPPPPPPPPSPPPTPPGGGDNGDGNGDKRLLKPEYQKAATTISAVIDGSLQRLLSIAIDMSFRRIDTFQNAPQETKVALKNEILDNMHDMMPILGDQAGGHVCREISEKLVNLEKLIIAAQGKKTTRLDPRTETNLSNKVAEAAVQKLKAENLVKHKTPVFGNRKTMTEDEKYRQDLRIIRMIRDSEEGGNAMCAIGVEEAAKRAYERGWIWGYKNARSAASAYGTRLHKSSEDAWFRFMKYTPEEQEEIVAMLNE